jgi:hypothetical protein
MSTISKGRYAHYADLLTFGRTELPIFATIAGETILLGATVFFADPPFLPVLVSTATALVITGLLTLFLAATLYILLSGIGYRTYSVKFHNPVYIFKCLVAYIVVSTCITYTGYLLLIYPYSSTIIPRLLDWGIGAVCSVAYATSITAVFYGHDFLSGDTKSKPETITTFLSAAQDLRDKPETDVVSEPGDLIDAGETIITGLKASDTDDSDKLSEDLQEWLNMFKQRDLRGQRKMVGDLPDTDIRFNIWEDRYKAFQHIRAELEKMNNSASHQILLCIRSESSQHND